MCVELIYHSYYFFFFKQKTAYDMRISDWSSDVCSSDLPHPEETRMRTLPAPPPRIARLPRDRHRRSIPWFVDYVDGEPDFRIADTRKMLGAITFPIGRASCRERGWKYV